MTDATSSRKLKWMGVLALLATATVWSLNGPLIKLLIEPEGTNPGMQGITIACYRSLIGGFVFLPFATRRWRTLGRVSIAWPIGSVITFTLMTACFVIATTQTAAANAIILQYTSPMWVFLLSPLLLREHVRPGDGLVLALAMIGVGIIFFGHPTREFPALCIGLASGLGYGSLTVMLRGLRPVNPVTVVAMNFLGSGLLLIPGVLLWASFDMTIRQSGFVLVLSVVQMAIPYMMFSWALKHVEAHQASLIVLLETVLNPILTYLIVGEPIPRPTLIGGPVILTSVIVFMLLGWRREVAARRGDGP